MLLTLLGCGPLGTWRPPTPAEEATLIDIDDLPLPAPPRWDVDVTNGRESGGVVEVWRTRHAGELRYAGEGSDEAFWVEGRRGRVLYQVAVAGAEPADRDTLLDWIGPTIDAIDAAAAP